MDVRAIGGNARAAVNAAGSLIGDIQRGAAQVGADGTDAPTLVLSVVSQHNPAFPMPI